MVPNQFKSTSVKLSMKNLTRVRSKILIKTNRQRHRYQTMQGKGWGQVDAVRYLPL